LAVKEGGAARRERKKGKNDDAVGRDLGKPRRDGREERRREEGGEDGGERGRTERRRGGRE